jgi:prepilin peptidase dependent protein B
MKNRHTQQGFTITELMITVTLGMSVISSILLGYLATYTSSMGTLANSRLNQEMSALMGVMIGELRRAGYFGDAASASTPTDNVFNAVNRTALEVYDDMSSNTQVASTGSGSCIVYSYDLDEDGVVDANELLGWRLNSNKVQVRTSGNTADPDTCATADNTWVDVTDPNFITVTALTFDLSGSACLNTREPDSLDNDGANGVDDDAEYDCYTQVPTAGSGDITVETREIAITLTGNLTNDSFVSISLNETVRVRNDWVRVR